MCIISAIKKAKLLTEKLDAARFQHERGGISRDLVWNIKRDIAEIQDAIETLEKYPEADCPRCVALKTEIAVLKEFYNPSTK
jgi:hypothetical protein